MQLHTVGTPTCVRFEILKNALCKYKYLPSLTKRNLKDNIYKAQRRFIRIYSSVGGDLKKTSEKINKREVCLLKCFIKGYGDAFVDSLKLSPSKLHKS